MTVATPVKTEVNPEVKPVANFDGPKPPKAKLAPATSTIGAPKPI